MNCTAIVAGTVLQGILMRNPISLTFLVSHIRLKSELPDQRRKAYVTADEGIRDGYRYTRYKTQYIARKDNLRM